MDVVASCAEGARCVGFVSSESVGSVLPLFGLVAGEVELDEEQQVRVDDAQTDLVTPRVVERGTVALPQVVPSDTVVDDDDDDVGNIVNNEECQRRQSPKHTSVCARVRARVRRRKRRRTRRSEES